MQGPLSTDNLRYLRVSGLGPTTVVAAGNFARFWGWVLAPGASSCEVKTVGGTALYYATAAELLAYPVTSADGLTITLTIATGTPNVGVWYEGEPV